MTTTEKIGPIIIMNEQTDVDASCALLCLCR